MRGFLVWVVGLSALAAMGCSRGGGLQSKAAVQSAIEAHLQGRSRLLLSNMTLEVQDAKFDRDHAESEVLYRSKQSPKLVVRVRYRLRRAGDRWEVESSSPIGGVGADPHMSQPAETPALAPAHSSELPAPQRSH